jgi:hypothetical protein
MFRIILRCDQTALGSAPWTGDLESAKVQAQKSVDDKALGVQPTSAEILDGNLQKIVYRYPQMH